MGYDLENHEEISVLKKCSHVLAIWLLLAGGLDKKLNLDPFSKKLFG